MSDLGNVIKRILGEDWDITDEEIQTMKEELREQAPYPWCHGNPTIKDCIEAGYCRRDPNCGE